MNIQPDDASSSLIIVKVFQINDLVTNIVIFRKITNIATNDPDVQAQMNPKFISVFIQWIDPNRDEICLFCCFFSYRNN